LFVEEGQRIYTRENVQEIFDASWLAGAAVWRVIGGVETAFYPFCQKACAMLAPDNIPEAAASRHIFFMMLPKLETEPRDAFKNRDDDELRELRRKAARFIEDHQAEIDAATPEMPEGFDNRLGAQWRIMFIIADLVGGDWPKKLRDAAVELRPDPAELISWHHRALRDLRLYVDIVGGYRDQYGKLTGKPWKSTPISSAKFVEWLLSDPDSEWHRYKGHKVNQWDIAYLFRQFYKVKPKVLGTERNRFRGYLPEQFAEYFSHVIRNPLPTVHPFRKGKQAPKPERMHGSKGRVDSGEKSTSMPAPTAPPAGLEGIQPSRGRLRTSHRLGKGPSGFALFVASGNPVAGPFATRAEAMTYAEQHPLEK
jgi:hypothetical protein